MRLSPAKQKHRAELNALRHLGQMPAADQRGAQPGQVALPQRGKPPVESFGDNQAKHRVAQKLQPLVIRARIASALGIALICQRTVRQSQFQQSSILEFIPEKACI